MATIIKLAKARERVHRYQAAFSSEDGLWVLADLKKCLGRPSYEAGKGMTFQDTAFNEGVKSVVRFIEDNLSPSTLERLNALEEKIKQEENRV